MKGDSDIFMCGHNFLFMDEYGTSYSDANSSCSEKRVFNVSSDSEKWIEPSYLPNHLRISVYVCA